MKKRAGQRVGKNHKTGFTFVELLIAMVIVAIVSGAVIMLGYTYLNHFEQANELSMARERGIMVMTYLEKRVLHTGIGMPLSNGLFDDAFSGLLAGSLSSWNQPLDNPVDETGSTELRIAYAVPSGVRTIASADVVTTSTTIELSGPVGGHIDTTYTETSTKDWVVFPSLRMPLRVTGHSDTSGSETVDVLAKVDEPEGWHVPANDEMHVVRFMRAFADGGLFKVEDMTAGTGEQPVVEGIVDCVFSVDDSGVLSVAVLARGNNRYDRYVAPADIDGWGVVPEDARHYHLTAVSKGWRIRN
jgi:prepilin-type N-terminal cleavage/methylation domain-containing protein